MQTLLEPGSALDIALQVGRALHYAHARGVVHRDIKPENLFLTREGSIKVLDFGIARLREFHSGGRATRSGAAMGTPSYMPPEQARGLWEEVDGSSDLWAVGATMFSLLSGRSVHEGRTPNEVLLSAMMRAAPPVATVASDVSRSMAQVVDMALAFDKASRWTDAVSMQAALRRSSIPAASKSTLKLPDAPPGFVPPVGSTRRLSTARPVALTVDPPPPPVAPTFQATTPSRSWLAVAIAIGAVVFVGMGCIVGVAVAWSRSTLRRPAPVLASTMLPAPVEPSTTVLGATPAPPPEAAPLPSAVASAPVSAPPPSATGRRPVASPAPAARKPPATAPAGECTPPYVIDPATGKKKWKEECL
jgi:serine/threonine-protein kinase